MRATKITERSQDDTIRRELQYLYDRRSAVEMLIRSLEYYDQFSSTRPISLDQKSA